MRFPGTPLNTPSGRPRFLGTSNRSSPYVCPKPDMRAVTGEAKSLESARDLYNALFEYRPALTGSDDQGYRVTVELGSGSDRQIIAILDALEEHVRQRASGPARIELDGRRYTMHPDDPTPERLIDVPAL